MSPVEEATLAVASGELEQQLEEQRKALTGYCYRMLGSPFEAEDAVQETMLRAWRGFDHFEGRAALRSWLFRIATNVCLDMLKGRERRALPMDFGPAQEPIEANLHTRPEVTWIEPIADSALAGEADPADVAVAHETIRLAFVAALQHLPPRQRAVLILCEVLRWQATEVGQLLDTSVASVNSALQRARATLAAQRDQPRGHGAPDRRGAAPVARALRGGLRAVRPQRAHGADQDRTPGSRCRRSTCGCPAVTTSWPGGTDRASAAGARGWFPSRRPMAPSRSAQYKPSTSGSGFDPWALQVIEFRNGEIVEFTFFLDTARLFPLYGLPARLDS